MPLTVPRVLRFLPVVLALGLAWAPLPSLAVTITAVEIGAAGGGGSSPPVLGIEDPVLVAALDASGASFDMVELLRVIALVSVLVALILPSLEQVRTLPELQAIAADNPGIELIDLGQLSPATYQLVVSDPPADPDLGLVLVAVENAVAVPLPATLPLLVLGLAGLLLARSRRIRPSLPPSPSPGRRRWC